MTRPLVAAVIPIRISDVCHPDASPKAFLNQAPLWSYTIEAALAAKSLDRIIVAVDDGRFAEHLKPYPRLSQPVLRPSSLSAPQISTLDVLTYVSEQAAKEGYTPDYFMLLEITHPVRPPKIIDQLIEIVAAGEYDSVFAAYEETYNYWYETEEGGFARVQVKSGHTRSPMYREMVGIGSLFRPIFLGTEDPFGQRVAVVPIKQLGGMIDARDEDGMWLAEQYLTRYSMRGRKAQ